MSVPSAEPLRPVTDDEVARFVADGVVHLPGILPSSWLDHLTGPVDETIADPSTTVDMTALGAELGGTGDPESGDGRFLSGVDHWLHHRTFAAFATTSPLPAIAAALMDASRIHLYEDSVLVKEPGTVEATVLHQDLGYFHLSGERICTCWVPLDPVTVDDGTHRIWSADDGRNAELARQHGGMRHGAAFGCDQPTNERQYHVVGR